MDTVVNNTLAIIGNFITSVMIFAFSGFEWSNFGILYFWSFMSFMTMTNFFKVVAAVTPTPANALQVAMPGLMLMILFNNFFVTKATAPPYMKWAIYISPMAWRSNRSSPNCLATTRPSSSCTGTTRPTRSAPGL